MSRKLPKSSKSGIPKVCFKDISGREGTASSLENWGPNLILLLAFLYTEVKSYFCIFSVLHFLTLRVKLPSHQFMRTH